MNTAPSMSCPVCSVALVISERQGIEIDYCPQCRGVWLDRGELDKLIERSITPVQQFQERQPSGKDYRDNRDQDDDYDRGYKKKRRKSFLEELFD
jgi:Zn-finger nucleic acid-binding protein